MGAASDERGEGHLFLTGATGHTGSRLARRLLERGRRLKCLNHNPDHARHLPQSERLEIVRGDVTRPESYAAALRGAAACYHLAHVGFAPQVIEACRQAGVTRLVSMSSTRRFTQFPEATARRVIAGEAALEASGLNYTIIRSAMIYGGDRDNNLEKIARWLKRRPFMPLVGGGRNLVQPIFTWDLVEALERALDAPGAARRALTVAGPAPMTQRAMIEAIARALGKRVIWLPMPYGLMLGGAWLVEKIGGKKPFVTRDQIRRQLEDKTFDIREASEALGGWQPRSFEEGILLKVQGKA